MRISHAWKKAAVLAALAAGAVVVDGAKPAGAQLLGVPAYEQVYVPARYKLKVNGHRVRRGVTLMPAGVVPRAAYVTASPLAVTETRYVPTVSVVPQRVYVPAPVVTRSYVPAATYVETQFVQPVTVIGPSLVPYP